MEAAVSELSYCKPMTILLGILCTLAARASAGPVQEIDLASDTAWTLRTRRRAAAPIRVPGGGWNSDLQNPPIDTMTGVKDHVIYQRKILVPQAG